MKFEDILNQISDEKSPSEIIISDTWAQGHTVFGGLSSALLYKAMRIKVNPSRVLRSMNTSFVSALKVDVPFRIHVEILREGRSVTQVISRAIQNDQVCVLIQASFGKSRDSRINVPAKSKPTVKPAKMGVMARYKEGFTPPFLQYFDISVCRGDVPFSNSKYDEIGGWIRFNNAKEVSSDEHIIAMIDAWPAPTLQMYDGYAPSSSLSWNLEFIHPHSKLNADSWFAYEAITRQAASGYCHTEANFWNESGELVAISRQAVVSYQ